METKKITLKPAEWACLTRLLLSALMKALGLPEFAMHLVPPDVLSMFRSIDNKVAFHFSYSDLSPRDTETDLEIEITEQEMSFLAIQGQFLNEVINSGIARENGLDQSTTLYVLSPLSLLMYQWKKPESSPEEDRYTQMMYENRERALKEIRADFEAFDEFQGKKDSGYDGFLEDPGV